MRNSLTPTTFVQDAFGAFTLNPTPGIKPANFMQGEKVLLVDDEPAIRKITALALTCLGHSVIVAQNGAEALKIAEANPDIRLLVTDIYMPQMNGFVLAAAMRRKYPKLKVLFYSGHTHLMENFPSQDFQNCDFLAKPTGIVDLNTKIKKLLKFRPLPIRTYSPTAIRESRQGVAFYQPFSRRRLRGRICLQRH